MSTENGGNAEVYDSIMQKKESNLQNCNVISPDRSLLMTSRLSPVSTEDGSEDKGGQLTGRYIASIGFLRKFVRFNKQTSGRDKLYRLFQYFGRFLAWYLNVYRAAPLTTIKKITKLTDHLSTGRK
eukprot:UC1_evm1s1767